MLDKCQCKNHDDDHLYCIIIIILVVVSSDVAINRKKEKKREEDYRAHNIIKSKNGNKSRSGLVWIRVLLISY